LSLKELRDLVELEVGAGDGKLANALSDYRLLTLLLEVEFDLILLASLHFLGGVLLAETLNLGNIGEGWLSKETDHEGITNENDTLLLLLDLLCKLG
jgi:hypothetical protein